LFRSALQKISLFSEIRNKLLSCISDVAGHNKKKTVKKEGFERLHKILSGTEIRDVNKLAKKCFRSYTPKIVKRFVNQVLDYDSKIYIGSNPMIRFFVPHDHYLKHRELFSEKQGSLKIQGPHHDEWFRNPRECLNIWMAMGRVQKGNGMVIYRDRWGDFIQHNGNREIPIDQSLGNHPVNFSMEPGDILLFHGAHLHTSELNRTDETRFVITSRFTTRQPTFSDEYIWRAFHNSKWVDTPFSFLSQVESYLCLPFLKKISKEVSQTVSKFLSVSGVTDDENQKDRHTATKYQEPIDDGVVEEENMIKIDASRIEEGTIVPVTDEVCVLKENDSLHAFSRFCPHEGADLAKGFPDHSNKSIHCAWHNLCINYQSGEHQCDGLSNLNTYPVTKLHDQMYSVEC